MPNFSPFRFLIFFLLALILAPVMPVRRAAAQADSLWSKPVNLSKSGSASQPRILVNNEGGLQVFWMDEFDGLTTVALPSEFMPGYDPAGWSDPRNAAIPQADLTTVPDFLIDSNGLVHAFWQGTKGSLLTARTPLSAPLWNRPEVVAESAISYQAVLNASGELTVVYVRTANTPDTPPGVYVQRRLAKFWGFPIPVYTSIYFRSLTREQAPLSLVDNGLGTYFLAWDEPVLGKAFYSLSVDPGQAWSTPEAFSQAETLPANPMVAVLPDHSLLRLWKSDQARGCGLVQQTLYPLAPETVTAVLAITSTQPLALWSDPMPVFEKARICPQGGRLWPDPVSGGLLWVWGQGTDTLNLSAWKPAMQEWSEPQALTFSFDDAETGRSVQLGDLQAVQAGEKLVVAGVDAELGDVWIMVTASAALELAYPPESPWAAPQLLTQSAQYPASPIMAADSLGRLHLVWSQAGASSAPGTSLAYARYDGQNLTRAIEIVRAAAGEITRQPALLIDAQDRLHLAWSGGTKGEIFYSRAAADQAASSGGWLPARVISYAEGASQPHMAQDLYGRLFVLYAVPLNEGRGLYLLHSQDGGDTWSDPALVFDAAAAGWEMVDQPSLAISSDGTLHAAWVVSGLPGAVGSQGIYYSLARPLALNTNESQALSWSPAREIAPAGALDPHLVALRSELHLVFRASNGLSQRWLDLSTLTPDGGGWGTITRIPGWQEFTSASSAGFALAVDAETMHLLGALPSAAADYSLPELHYTAWKWGAGRWNASETLALDLEAANGAAAAAAIPLTGGRLALAWQAQSTEPEGSAGLYFTHRAAPAVQAPSLAELFLPTPTPEPTLGPTPTQSLPTPTPTPDLNRVSQPAGEGLSPMIVGGVLAGVAVVLLFALILLVNSRRR